MKPKQIKALEILVRGEFDNYDDVAAELKISPRTLYNWRNDDEFAAELERRLKIKLGGIAPRALHRQEELLEAKSEMVAHLAAKDILDRAGLTAENVVKIEGMEPVRIINNIPVSEEYREAANNAGT